MVSQCVICGSDDVRNDRCGLCGHVHVKVGGRRRGRSSKKDRFKDKDSRLRNW